MYIVDGKEYVCTVPVTLSIFNDKWKLDVIWYLLEGEKRYTELFDVINKITKKTLTAKLRELEEKGLINRVAYAEVPPKVIYSLTPLGKELKPLLEEMYKWGMKYVEARGEIVKD
ncbi:MAG: transcriptional regulator [Arcobacter sp.]|nr:MAG: transcriptional regulator [Arcobacter sp.]